MIISWKTLIRNTDVKPLDWQFKEEIMIKFNFKDITFEVKEVDGLYDLNDLRKQVVKFLVDNSQPKDSFKSPRRMDDWKKYLSTQEVAEYKYVSSGNGRGARTLANKQGLVAYCSWLNVDFKLALQRAFVAIAEGRDSDAREIVGQSMIDMEMVKRVEEKWKAYIKWSYEKFSPVNKTYGANMVRMVLESSLGVSAKSSIKGKTNNAVIQRLVEQNHGDAILALNATLSLVKRTVQTGIFNELAKDRDGLKQIYKHVKSILEWEEE